MSDLSRFLAAVELVQQDTSIMERQLKRMEERTASGIDVKGASFLPYKRLPKDGRQTPLGRGGLLTRARVDSATSLDGADLRATVTGTTARIAYYQNRRRQFWGFSTRDCEDMVADFKANIAQVARRIR